MNSQHNDNSNTNVETSNPNVNKKATDSSDTHISPFNGIFAIHVSKLNKDTTTDDVTAIIVSKIQLHPDILNLSMLKNYHIEDTKETKQSFHHSKSLLFHVISVTKL